MFCKQDKNEYHKVDEYRNSVSGVSQKLDFCYDHNLHAHASHNSAKIDCIRALKSSTH